MQKPLRPLRRAHLRFASLIAGLTIAILAPGAQAAPVPTAPSDVAAPAASSPATMAGSLLGWVNQDRAARGLRPLRADATLAALAQARATNLANSAAFSHDAAGGDIGRWLSANHFQWYMWAEDIAWSNATYGSGSIHAIYAAWKGSPSHWAALMSNRLNYVGFGVAYRSGDHRTFSSAVFSESRDHTRPSARVSSATLTGTTITFRWRGADAALQSHWRGLRDFDVEYRADGGAWRLVRNNTTGSSLTLRSRHHGHAYAIRVRSRDWAGNVSAWSSARTVRVP